LHILGYGVDSNYQPLQKKLTQLQEFREKRNYKMVGNLQKHGFAISWDELVKVAGSDLVGRPHFAQLLLQKGYVQNKQEAFDKYLKKGAPFYLDKKRMEPAEAIQLIRAAGGFAALAHPCQTGLQAQELESLVHDLAYEGLQGIEVYYSQHKTQQITEYKNLAAKYDLIITGGSDFHGANKPHIPLGMEIKKDELEKFIIKMRKFF
jgi:predicted metal-dependent phosphoesterase TrpH